MYHMLFTITGKPIFSIDIHPDDSRVATGGQGMDYVAYLLICLFIYTFDRSTYEITIYCTSC